MGERRCVCQGNGGWGWRLFEDEEQEDRAREMGVCTSGVFVVTEGWLYWKEA